MRKKMNFTVFNCSKEDLVGKPLYSRFTKTNDFKGVPHPLSGDYTPTPQEEIGSIGTSPEHSIDPESEISSVPPEVPNINTGRTNVNPVRPRVNTGSSNVNTVRSRQPVPNKTSNSFSPKRPQETSKPHCSASEVTNSAVLHKLQVLMPLRKKKEDVELIFVPSLELEEIALKHLGKVTENTTTSTPLVNTGSKPVNTGSFDPDDSPMPELEIFHRI
ncbi:hypothetical protein Tco_0371100 [Tanacetum coccineum]